MFCNGNGVLHHLQMEVAVMGYVKDFCYSLHNSLKHIFCLIWNLLCDNGNLKANFPKKMLNNSPYILVLPSCKLPFPNGVTEMGFAEHFGRSVIQKFCHILSIQTLVRALKLVTV